MEGAGLTIRELDFEATFDAGPNAFALSGNADASVSAQLHDLVERIHESCSRDVTLDLRSLEFMAASCFNVFVMWIGLINERALEARYQLRFAINPAVPWQKRSLATLTCFATDIVKVEP
jgi:hypothetical protein